MIRILVLLLLTVPTTMAQATFHGDTARTGVYSTPGPQQLKGTKWTFKTDGPIIGSPAIANGVIYIGSTDGNVYALDQETGKQIMRLLRAVVRSEGVTALVATHDPVLIDLADEVLQLQDGKITAS